jgi:hypothetical protein
MKTLDVSQIALGQQHSLAIASAGVELQASTLSPKTSRNRFKVNAV